MNTHQKSLWLGIALTLVSASGVAQARCPAGLSAEELISCIHTEGAGVDYQNYLAERAARVAASERSAATAADKPASTTEAPAEKVSVRQAN